MSNNKDKQLIEKRILISEKSWEQLLALAEQNKIQIFQKDESVISQIDKTLGQVTEFLKTPVVVELVTFAKEEYQADRKKKDKEAPEALEEDEQEDFEW